jgi:hypothetical protein
MGLASRSTSLIAAASFALALVAGALLVAGCGSTGDGTSTASSTEPTGAPAGASAQSCESGMRGVAALSATEVSCATAIQIFTGWKASHGCAPSPAATRSTCSLGRYRCLSLVNKDWVAVSCARAGHSVSFLARR